MTEVDQIALATRASESPTSAAVRLSAWYALGVLTLVYACQFMDRQIVAILLEPIRREFHLTDSQLGVLTGIALSVPFAVAGIPLGIVADRVNRRRLLALLLLIWSTCTAACGLATTFPMLLLARVAVGASEAGGYPAAMAMVGDSFPERRRSVAASIFQSGSSLGAVAAYLLGGLIAQAYGWRAAFFLAFVPGLAISLLLLFTVRDAPRRSFGPDEEAAAKSSFIGAFVDALTFLRGRPALIHLVAAMVVSALGLSAYAAWLASFYVRTYGVSLSHVGTIVGVTGLFGALAHIGTSHVADRLGARNPRWPLFFSAVCSVLVLPLGLILANQGQLAGAVAVSATIQVFAGVCIPIIYANILNLTPQARRGRVLSIVTVLANMIGYGLGPLLTGLVSDAFGGALRIALAVISIYGAWAGAHFVLAARHVRQRA